MAAAPRASRIENVEGPGKVHFKIKARIGHGSCDRYLRGKVINLVRVRHGPFHQPRIAHITHRHLQPAGRSRGLAQPFQVMVHSRAGEVVKNVHLRIGVGKQRVGQIRPNKACPSKNQHRAGFLLPHCSPFNQKSLRLSGEPKLAELRNGFSGAVLRLLQGQPLHQVGKSVSKTDVRRITQEFARC